jgi:hypothetical protein
MTIMNEHLSPIRCVVLGHPATHVNMKKDVELYIQS